MGYTNILEGCMANKKTTIEYLEELEAKNIPYTLLGEYITNDTPVLHECPKGHQWNVRPSNILSGRGCPTCSGKKKKTTDEYQAELDRLGKGYKVLEPYVNTHTKLLHQCSNGHTWYVIPKDLVGMKKTNCPYCINRYFDYSKPAILYYIKINHPLGTFYKVGVTKNSLEERYKGKDLYIIEPLLIKEYEEGWKAIEAEKEILAKFREYIINDSTLLERGGKGTEIFKENVLQL
jgi:hypothetical protein